MSTFQLGPPLADQMVENAVAVCAEKKFNGDRQAALLALRQGRCDACRHVSDSLVGQVGEYLGQIDRTVKAVYEFEAEQSALRSQNGDDALANRKAGLNLIAWVDRKTPVLLTLGSTLESLLADSRRSLGCKDASPTCCTLTVQMVDDKDMLEQRGYGAIVKSAYFHSTQVWARPDAENEPSQVNKTGQGIASLLDPELTPEDILLDQALAIEKMTASERASREHHLRELKVALIRKLISDQLAYINIAKEWFTIADLADIHQRKIGYGKIGGKSAGMLLAARILNEVGDESLRACIRIPESYFIGSDGMYIFMAMNGLMHWNDQKYKPEEQIRSDYPLIRKQFQAGVFPPEMLAELRMVLEKIGPSPVIAYRKKTCVMWWRRSR